MEFKLHKVCNSDNPGAQILFLLLEDGTFIAGQIEFHFKLWYAFCFSTGRNPTDLVLSGAGSFYLNLPGVSTWESTGYRFLTPEENQVIIEKYIETIKGEFAPKE